MTTVADCERAQSRWFETRASVLGGETWTDEGQLWTDGPDGLNVLFPRTLTSGLIARAVSRARRQGRDIVGAWLSPDVDAAPLAAAGFERGWSPWWMTAELADVPRADDPRVRLEQDTLEYRGEHAAYREQLALARLVPQRAWYAAAHLEPDVFAGRAWSFLDADVAGIFDMAVWPPFRRQGLGTALVAAVCDAARRAGAHTAVLNATPEGYELYRRCGFTKIGEGITWWLHLQT